ncbi:FtsX-like permease family protein [Bacillus sp. MRMR6]|uniref:FtsX-like permease family protein n=1 Tax=Bacillus sp. MRMR6 TaxID=1928617 RepID=UPI000951C751|nr:FtsX-like permease family protein [Bacillus sp. MRMR6]OLS33667.1 cell division protein FtsX [Bacillus sp. MRMR6]
MNIINTLTIRHLKENKRRTLVTIIGVIISVAMVTAVSILGVSFLDLLKRQTIATDGEWHVKYDDVNSQQLEAIEKDEETKSLIISNDLGYANLERSKNSGKPYLFFKEYNEKGFTQFPIELSEGRFPQAEDEVVLSEEIANNAKVAYEIGDKITFEIGNRIIEGGVDPLTQTDPLQTDENGSMEELVVETTKTVTVVGTINRPTWEPAWSPGYTVIGYVDQEMLTKSDTVDAVVVLKNVNGSLYEHADQLVSEWQIKKVGFNSELLRYYGVTDRDNLRTTLFSLAAIIMAVIIIGSVALIYNAFAISVSERSRHLGMLASVGATKRQKRNSVFFEGAIIGALSIPIGILAGLAGMAVTFAFINRFLGEALNVTEKLLVVATPSSMLTACAISIVTILISTYLPARRASKVSAIDAIRQSQDVKLTGKAVKTSKLIRKVFGMEAEIGLKNLKRNKRRYQATVFSLVISIVLFLAVSFFTSSLEKSLKLSQEEVNFDIQVMGDQTGSAELKPLSKVDYVTESSMVEQLYLTTWIDEREIADELKVLVKEDNSILKDGKYPYQLVLQGLDEESYKAFAKKAGLDPEKLDNTTGIVIDKISYKDYESGKVIETKTIQTEVGKSIDLFAFDYESEEERYLNKVQIGALTDQVPMGVRPSGLGMVDIVVSEKTLHQLIDAQLEEDIQVYLYMNSSDPLATQDALDKVKSSNMYVYNVYQNRQRDQQMIMLMSVFTYGFIALISLISIANIFNTISTSISLRKREFAMLRSVGMTPKGFNKMIHYESVFYGVKALVFGLPISLVVMVLIYWSLRGTFEYGFALPWMSIIYVILAIFMIVSLAMLYSIGKIKKENIIDGLKQENI